LLLFLSRAHVIGEIDGDFFKTGLLGGKQVWQHEQPRTLCKSMIVNHQIKAKRIGGSIRIPHEELAKIVREY